MKRQLASIAIGMPLSNPVKILPKDPESASLWSDFGRLASTVLPDGWTLVGGLMVQLHAYEAGVANPRVTTDIDILADARERAVERVARALEADDFQLDPPSPIDGTSHRWRRGELVVDLLAPDGLRRDPAMIGNTRTVQIPGGTQALARTETIDVEIDGLRLCVHRPTLLGAVLIKSRAILVHSDPDAQRADLILLLSLIHDPRQMAAQLKGRERSWLRKCEQRLRLDDPVLMAPFPADRVRRANLAFRLLVV